MGKWLLVLLLTHASDPRSDVVVAGPAGLTTVARVEHLPEASLRGALGPGGLVLVAADRAPGRDRSFSSSLMRVEAGKPVVELCDRLMHASRPLVTPAGRVFVERGQKG